MAGEAGNAGGGRKSYQMGDVGKGARVAQGENITWLEGLSTQPGGDELRQQFEQLLERLANAPGLDADERELAGEKTRAVAEALSRAEESPEGLRKALRDARAFLTTSADWAWEGMRGALTSAPAQQIVSTMSEAGAKAAVQAMIGTT